jgi:hypothetical protein
MNVQGSRCPSKQGDKSIYNRDKKKWAVGSISERLRWGERLALEKYILNKPVPTWLHALIRNDGLLKYKNHVKHK